MSYQNSNSFFCQHLLASFPLPKKNNKNRGNSPAPKFPENTVRRTVKVTIQRLWCHPGSTRLIRSSPWEGHRRQGEKVIGDGWCYPPPGEIWKTKPFLTLKKLFNLILWKLMCRVVWKFGHLKKRRKKTSWSCLVGSRSWILGLFCLKIVFLMKVTRRYAGRVGFFCSCKKCGKSVFIYYLHKYIRYQDIFHLVKPKPLRTSTRRQDSCGVGMVADLTGAGHG